MIRFFDIVLSMIGIVMTMPILLLIIVCLWGYQGSPIFFQARLGMNQRIFTLYKIRTLKLGSPGNLPSHLMPAANIIPLGRFLRKSKIDELPQLLNVLIGDMSLVGPRPNLPSQIELINWRNRLGVYSNRPGITGLAQIRGIDMSDPEGLARTDAEMLFQFGLKDYFRLLLATAVPQILGFRAGRL